MRKEDQAQKDGLENRRKAGVTQEDEDSLASAKAVLDRQRKGTLTAVEVHVEVHEQELAKIALRDRSIAEENAVMARLRREEDIRDELNAADRQVL
jgi:hypothetical protein